MASPRPRTPTPLAPRARQAKHMPQCAPAPAGCCLASRAASSDAGERGASGAVGGTETGSAPIRQTSASKDSGAQRRKRNEREREAVAAGLAGGGLDADSTPADNTPRPTISESSPAGHLPRLVANTGDWPTGTADRHLRARRGGGRDLLQWREHAEPGLHAGVSHTGAVHTSLHGRCHRRRGCD